MCVCVLVFAWCCVWFCFFFVVVVVFHNITDAVCLYFLFIFFVVLDWFWCAGFIQIRHILHQQQHHRHFFLIISVLCLGILYKVGADSPNKRVKKKIFYLNTNKQTSKKQKKNGCVGAQFKIILSNHHHDHHQKVLNEFGFWSSLSSFVCLFVFVCEIKWDSVYTIRIWLYFANEWITLWFGGGGGKKQCMKPNTEPKTKSNNQRFDHSTMIFD